MTKLLAEDDFRSRRWVLEDDDFALVHPADEGYEPKPMVSEEAWHSIMDLTDDVAIRTTDNLGQRLEFMWNLWTALTEDFEKVENDGKLTLLLDCGERFQAATFTTLTGYYREAYSCLRGIVEYSVYGIYMADHPERVTALASAEFTMPPMGSMCDALAVSLPMRSLDRNLQKARCRPLFLRGAEAANKGLVRALYADLCRYAHANPITTNAALWKSNGPVFEPTQLLRIYDFYCDCFLLLYFAISTGHQASIRNRQIPELLEHQETELRKSLHFAFAWGNER